MHPKDDILVHRTLCGDESAFALLVERYQGVVYRIAYREIENHHDAEDIAQEAFLKAYCKLKTLKDPNTFSSWLYAITVNLCKSWWRKRKRQMETIELAEVAPPDLASCQSYERQEQQAVLWDSINELASKDRRIMTMFYREGYSTKEIGEQMGITQNQVLVRLHRARKQLKEEFIMAHQTQAIGEMQPSFIEQVMERIYHSKPTSPPNNQPLAPWLVTTTLAVIALLVGLGVMETPWFQAPYSLTGDESAVKVELTEAPVFRMPLPKQVTSKGTGLSGTNGDGSSSNGSALALASNSQEGEKTLETGWTQTNGPYGGTIQTLLATPKGTLYAVTRGVGIFRLSDDNSWVPINKGFKVNGSRIYISSLVMMGDTLYAGSGFDIFRSTDGGEEWQWVTRLENKSVTTLAVMGNTLYAGTHQYGVLRSTDGGEEWTEVNTGLTDLRIRELTVMGTTLYAGTKDGAFRLADNGNSWIPINAGLTAPRNNPEAISNAMIKSGVPPMPISKFMIDRRVDSFAVLGDTLYMGMVNGLFRSVDKGKSWRKIGLGYLKRSVSALTVSGTTLYAGTFGGGVFRSTDGGASWTEINMGLTNYLIHSLLAVKGTLYAGTSGGGVFRLVEKEDSWREINNGLTNTMVSSLVFLENTLYGYTNNGIVKSIDGGESWTTVNTGLMTTSRIPYVSALVVSGPTLYAATPLGGGVFRLEDGGNSWIEVNLKLSRIHSLVVIGTTFYAGTSGEGVFRLEAGNDSCTYLGVSGERIDALAVSGTKIYAGTAKGGIFRSVDGGTSWSQVNEGLTNRIIMDLVFVGTTIYAGTFGDGVFRSTDGGNSWTSINEGLTDTTITVLSVSKRTLYAGTHYHGVFRLDKDNKEWKPVGSMHRDVRSLAVSGKILYAGTMFEGVFRISLER